MRLWCSLYVGRLIPSAFTRKVLAVVTLSLCILTLSEGSPTLLSSRFESLPEKLIYFEDSSVILWLDKESKSVFRSQDEGGTWTEVETVKGKAGMLYEHPFEPKNAFILTKSNLHYMTNDRGATWRPFEVPLPPASDTTTILNFHAERSNYIIYTGERCEKREEWIGDTCHDETFYTKDSFLSASKPLRTHTATCIWARSTKELKSTPEQMIFCLEFASASDDGGMRNLRDVRAIQSEDFFATTKSIQFGTGKEVRGVTGLGSVAGGFIVAAVTPVENSNEMILYVTKDGEKWIRALFPLDAGLKENSYTILESSPHSLFVDVVTTLDGAWGTLFSSNSDGTYFRRSLEHTNRDISGIVGIEKTQGIDGILIANVVDNWNEVQGPGSSNKHLKSMITFDNGGNWNYITKVVDKNGETYSCKDQEYDCTLNLWSLTKPHNVGPVFTSAGAPGVVMGVGSVGKWLKPYDDCDTFISVDGGINWRLAREGAHKYEFGDMGGLIVLIDDEDKTDHLWYSSDYGKNWIKYDLNFTIRAQVLTTDPDSTSANFLLIGRLAREKNERSDLFEKRQLTGTVIAFRINFEGLHSNQCTDSDFEEWVARDITPGIDCLMGHETAYRRRKPDAACFVGRKYQDPVIKMTNCPCTSADFECDYNYIRDSQSGECIVVGQIEIPEGQCRGGESKFWRSPGYRLIPGNTCEGGKDLGRPVEDSCAKYEIPNTSPQEGHDPISHKITTFDNEIDQINYFRNSKSILMSSMDGTSRWSRDEGANWETIEAVGADTKTVIFHEFDDRRAYIFTDTKLFVTTDTGESWEEITLPAEPTKMASPLLDFHPDNKDWLLFIGEKACPSSPGNPCHTEVYISTDHGRGWNFLSDWAIHCNFGRDAKFPVDEKTIFCISFKNKNSKDGQDVILDRGDLANNPLVLTKLSDFTRDRAVNLLDHALGFYVFENYMAVATENAGQLDIFISMDGKSFANVNFPPNVRIDRNTFTILQSTTGSIFLNVLKSSNLGSSYGTLFKSNSDGRFYSVSLDSVNCAWNGFVDFEKAQGVGIEGIILSNQVTNVADVAKGVPKKIRSVISMDDGATWKGIKPPKKDSTGQTISCTNCSLHLHSRTEIPWWRPGAIFSSGGAPGMMMGVGNVGPFMTDYKDGNTYLTRDAGLNWFEVRKGESMYEFGDHGALLVLVDDSAPTNQLLYSKNGGQNWDIYTFSDSPVRIDVLTTEPKGTSSTFLMRGHTIAAGGQNAQPVIVIVDFSKVHERKCTDDDFEDWTLKDDDNQCVLGRELTFKLKKLDADCYIGKPYEEPSGKEKLCVCTKNDFECDIGFWRNEQGDCVLYGPDPKRPDNCKPGEEYDSSNGYRKNPKSSCKNGENLEKSIRRTCGEANSIQSRRQEFFGDMVDYFYIPNSTTVVIRTTDNQIWKSENDGYSWNTLFTTEDGIVGTFQNPYFPEKIYFISSGLKLWVSNDKLGSSMTSYALPNAPGAIGGFSNILRFHPEERGSLIYIGTEGCDTEFGQECHSVAHFSRDDGITWSPLGSYMRSCAWALDKKFTRISSSTIFCESYLEKSGNQRTTTSHLQFVSGNNYFANQYVLFEDIVGFAIFEEFLVVAEYDESRVRLHLRVSLDGIEWAESQFPPDLNIIAQSYTVMESVTSSIMLHVTTNTIAEYGTIFKSNSNGTFYSISLTDANRNQYGIVDFEKMQGIDGIAIANKVINPNDANNKKKLQTMITFNDGGEWEKLKPPKKDSTGQEYHCSTSDCSLHLHSYSERRNSRDLISHPSAPGLMIAVGNVGSSLTEYNDGDVFLTRDAGETWREVRKGAHLWEFGDQGGILVLVDDEQPTDHLLFSQDEGLSFAEYRFSQAGEQIRVKDIITQPEGSSQKFVILGKAKGSGKQVAYYVDFSGLRSRQCKLDITNEKDDDFEPWRPLGDRCLFGRQVEYYRRIEGRDCFIGKLDQPRKLVETCQCTPSDFECEYNYYRDQSGKCILYPKAKPLASNNCSTNQETIYERTAYRKIPFSTCEGGDELDKGKEIWCEGHGYSGGTWFLMFIIPFSVAGLLAFCWNRRKRQRVGAIRLPENVASGSPLFAKIGQIVINIFSIVPDGLYKLAKIIRLPAFISDRFGQTRYSPLGQEEPADLQLEDYDGVDGHFLDEEGDEDADEL